MKKKLNFLKEFCKNNQDIGSVLPDSKQVIDALLKHAPFGSARTFLEYGPASGAVTREIIKRIDDKSILVCVEKNKHFYEELVKTTSKPGVYLVNDDAFSWVNNSAGSCGIRGGDVDVIISTLPCSSLDFETFLHKSVLPLLKKDGVFIQYMYTIAFLKGFRLRPLLEEHFTDVSSELVVSNVPPAMVYTSRGLINTGNTKHHKRHSK
ncbi:MAG: rRNA adenine N-6-methyltransferase family protein [Elusimicrobiaceae bacterium]